MSNDTALMIMNVIIISFMGVALGCAAALGTFLTFRTIRDLRRKDQEHYREMQNRS